MAVYTGYTAAEYAPDAPATSDHFKRWFENWEAGFQGAAGAPKLLDAAHPTFAAGTVDLENFLGLNVVVQTSYSGGGAGSGTAYTAAADFAALNAGGLRLSVDMQNASGTGVARVSKNGVVLATLTCASTSYVTYTADFTFQLGDRIKIERGVVYAFGSGGGTDYANHRNIKIQGNKRGVYRT